MPDLKEDDFDLSIYEDAKTPVYDLSLQEADFPDGNFLESTSRRSATDGLDPEFKKKLDEVVTACGEKNVDMVPYTGIRNPWKQARLWRRSRTTATVNRAIAQLKANGAPHLADVVEAVGPQATGSNVTGALPGFSWHQWGEGADSYWSVDGKPEWDKLDGYKTYAGIAKDKGLTAGGYWTRKDWPHVQYRSEGNPRLIYSYEEIDAEMLKRFGATEP